MVRLLEQQHVARHYVPPAPHKVYRVSTRHDFVCRERELGNGRTLWYSSLFHIVTRFPLHNTTYPLVRTQQLTHPADYVDQQKYLSHHLPTLFVHNNAFVAIASSNIFVGIYVATIFGAAFFFDLFWPARRESRAVKTAWKICSVLACALTLACAIAYTYVVVVKRAWVTRPDGWRAGWEAVRVGLAGYHGSTLRYQKNGRAVTSVVFLWVGMVCTFARYVVTFSPRFA
jgi:hypothetical protein